jgi:hypothetical protein
MIYLLAFVCIGIAAGMTAGHLHRKQSIRTIKFVTSTQTSTILEKNHIKLDETSKCSVCSQKITIENIGAILHTESGDTFVCSKKSCHTLSKIVS